MDLRTSAPTALPVAAPMAPGSALVWVTFTVTEIETFGGAWVTFTVGPWALMVIPAGGGWPRKGAPAAAPPGDTDSGWEAIERESLTDALDEIGEDILSAWED